MCICARGRVCSNRHPQHAVTDHLCAADMDASDPLFLLCLANGDGIRPSSCAGTKDNLQLARDNVMAVLRTCAVWLLIVAYGKFDFESFWKYFMVGKSLPRIIDVRCATFASIEDMEKLLKTTWDSDCYVRFHFYYCMVDKGGGELTEVSQLINEQHSWILFDRRVEVEKLKGSKEKVFGSSRWFPGRQEGGCEDFCTEVKRKSEQKQNHTAAALTSAGILNKSDFSLFTEAEVLEMELRKIALCTVGAGIGSRFSGWDPCVAKAAMAAEEAMAAAAEAMNSTTNSRKRSRSGEE